jgi:hypothetical protein
VAAIERNTSRLPRLNCLEKEKHLLGERSGAPPNAERRYSRFYPMKMGIAQHKVKLYRDFFSIQGRNAIAALLLRDSGAFGLATL